MTTFYDTFLRNWSLSLTVKEMGWIIVQDTAKIISNGFLRYEVYLKSIKTEAIYQDINEQ